MQTMIECMQECNDEWAKEFTNKEWEKLLMTALQDMPIVKVKLLSQDAKLPTKNDRGDAGWDLYASDDMTIEVGRRRPVKTDIAIQIPNEWVGLIWPRSGLAVKHGIDTLAGVIDSTYRGEIKVILQHHGSMPIIIKKGDRIAQILFQSVPDVQMVLADELEESNRGQQGFGSSGK